MMVMTRVMVMIGVMTTPCETLKADGVGARQQLGNVLLPIEHACEEGFYNTYYILYYIMLPIEHACEEGSR